MDITQIWVNCPSIEAANAITEALLGRELIASANRYAPIQSSYVWDGKIQHAEEHPLLLKTRVELFALVEDTVRALHPYEVPPIIRTAVDSANADYVAWVHKVTRDP